MYGNILSSVFNNRNFAKFEILRYTHDVKLQISQLWRILPNFREKILGVKIIFFHLILLEMCDEKFQMIWQDISTMHCIISW